MRDCSWLVSGSRLESFRSKVNSSCQRWLPVATFGVRSVGIKTLRNRLSEYVKLAAGGETILICARDRVVAELHAPSPARAESPTDATLAALLREGVLSGPLDLGAPLPERLPLVSLDDLMGDLGAFREDR